MKLNHKAAAVLSVVALLGGLSACGGSDRPSKDDLVEAMQSGDSGLGTGDLPDEMADCMAGILHKSDLSDEALQAIVDKDEDYEPSDDDEKALEDIQSNVLEECAPDMPEVPEPSEAE